jgi:hypothetical protein
MHRQASKQNRQVYISVYIGILTKQHQVFIYQKQYHIRERADKTDQTKPDKTASATTSIGSIRRDRPDRADI